jgi:hypothetical protein
MAITTSNSTSVKPRRERRKRQLTKDLLLTVSSPG